MKDRVASEIDTDLLEKLFVYLGFHTNCYNDLTGAEICRRLKVRGSILVGVCMI